MINQMEDKRLATKIARAIRTSLAKGHDPTEVVLGTMREHECTPSVFYLLDSRPGRMIRIQTDEPNCVAQWHVAIRRVRNHPTHSDELNKILYR